MRKGSSHPQFSQEGLANICIYRQTPESTAHVLVPPQNHPRVHGVCGNKNYFTSPNFHYPLLKLNSSHSRSMTSTWVTFLMEKKALKLEDLGEKSLVVVLKSRTHFLCYFYISSCSLSLRSLVPNKRDSEKEQQ